MSSTMTDMGMPPMVRHHLERASPRVALASGLPERVLLGAKVLAAEALFVQRVSLLYHNYHPSRRSARSVMLRGCLTLMPSY